MAIDPRYLDVSRWTALTAQYLIPLGFIPKQATDENWRQWADSAKRLPQLGGYQVPDPRLYADWRLWAYRLNEALLSLGIV